jgi:methylenetetrahydrofolate reductase (NADPH)
MPQESVTGVDRSAVQQSLADVTFDTLPGDGFEDALTHLPAGSRLAVVLTPHLGMDQTVEKTVLASERGHEVVPHVAARFMKDADELDRVAARLQEAGVTDLFVVGGDRDEPAGEFECALDVLLELERLGYDFDEVGIGGYPTGHEEIPTATLHDAMGRKAPHATYLVTQMCFDADEIVDWIDGVRDRGIELPVEVGIAGVMEYRRLMTLARRWGVTNPLEFARKTAGVFTFLRELVLSGGHYAPDDMLPVIATKQDDPRYDIRRLRLYTFNQTRETEVWRQGWLGE